MATILSPFGFESTDTTTSASWSGKTGPKYQINPADTTPIYQNDIVTIVGGYVTKYTSTHSAANLPALGVFRGCYFVPTNASSSADYGNYNRIWPGLNNVTSGTKVEPIVEDDPDLIFKAQSNSQLGVTVAADLKNTRISFAAATAASIANGTSTMGVDTSGTAPVAANPTYTLKIVGVWDAAAGYTGQFNDWSTSGLNAVVVPYPILLCKINNHVYRSGTDGMA